MHSAKTKRVYLVFAVFVILLAVALPTFADAGFNWKVWTWGDELAKFYVTALVTFIAFIPSFIFFLVAGVTTWFIKLAMDIGVAPGSDATPTFLVGGWNFSRP